MDDCRHILIVIYRRPWWAPWRRVNVIRCFLCDVRAEDPLSDLTLSHGPPEQV